MLAAIYSVFIVALKYDLSLIRRTAKDSIKVGLVASFLPSVVTLSLLYLLGSAIHGFPNSPMGKYFKYFMTVFVSFSYFPVIAQALDDLNLMTSELGQFAMSTAIVNDVIQWTLTTFYLIMMQQNISSHGVQGFLTFLALIIFAVYIIRPIILWIISNTPAGEEVKEVYVVAIQLGALLMAFICDSLGATATMGAVILGLIIPEGPPLGTTLVHKTEALVSEFLLPMFFFRIGYSLDVYSISDWVSFSQLQILITVSYFTKIVGITGAALWCKFGLKNSLMLSMAMSTKGIIETTILNRWRNSKVINYFYFILLLF